MKALVLVASGLHLGYIGCYGNEWVATPALDRLAAEGVVFDQHYADCPIGLRWTGLHAVPADQGPGGTPDLPALLARQDLPVPFIPSSNLVGGLQSLGQAERWLLWVELPNLYPPWSIGPRFLRRYFHEDDGADADPDEPDEEPLTPLTDPPIGPVDIDDFTLLDRLQSTYAAAVTHLDEVIGGIV